MREERNEPNICLHFSRSPTVHNLPPLFPLACKARKLRSCPHRFFARPVIPVAFTSSIAHASSDKAGKRSCNWALVGSCTNTRTDHDTQCHRTTNVLPSWPVGELFIAIKQTLLPHPHCYKRQPSVPNVCRIANIAPSLPPWLRKWWGTGAAAVI